MFEVEKRDWRNESREEGLDNRNLRGELLPPQHATRREEALSKFGPQTHEPQKDKRTVSDKLIR